MAFPKSRPDYTFDAALELKDAGLLAASGVFQVGGANRILDVGTGHFRGDCVIDVSALEIASGDERYTVIIQGSTSPTFASVIANLAELSLGDGSAIGGAQGTSGVDVDDTTGRYVLPFTNERNGVYYPYLRGRLFAAGTIATGINLRAWVSTHE
jgi:hypothetical protein